MPKPTDPTPVDPIPADPVVDPTPVDPTPVDPVKSPREILVSDVSSQTGVPADQVDAVLTAYKTLQAGDPAGMVRHAADGVALRIADSSGVNRWGVLAGDGSFYFSDDDLSDWDVIFEPSVDANPLPADGV